MRPRALALAALLAAGAAHASLGSPPLCDADRPLGAAEQDRLLRFAAVVKRELDDARGSVALISRSGIDLARFRVRYSHAGVALRTSGEGWSVRQLYYACDERRPRLYDQGVAGFLSSTDDPALGYVSIVLLPRAQAAELGGAALDNARALRLLAARYSANAYPFSLRYQNCNQWLAELIAAAWGALPDGADLRARAQGWLLDHGYAPAPVEVGSHWLMFAGGFVPWIHVDDHPEDDVYALHFRVSLPASIEAFVHARVPAAERIELCHDERRVVVHRGWTRVAEGCVPEPGDRVIELD